MITFIENLVDVSLLLVAFMAFIAIASALELIYINFRRRIK